MIFSQSEKRTYGTAASCMIPGLVLKQLSEICLAITQTLIAVPLAGSAVYTDGAFAITICLEAAIKISRYQLEFQQRFYQHKSIRQFESRRRQFVEKLQADLGKGCLRLKN